VHLLVEALHRPPDFGARKSKANLPAPASCRSAFDADLFVGRSIETGHARQMAESLARFFSFEGAHPKTGWPAL
jgi:hypothetical protein